VILLDTNVLIRMLVAGAPAAGRVSRWITAGEDLCTSAICWYEFVSGPVDDEGIALVSAAIADRVIPFTADHARESSRLWNATGRARRMRIDAMVAAAAIVTGAELATENRDDFTPFVAFGLHLNGDVPRG
jgi:predicted nucleic acid-binding protein